MGARPPTDKLDRLEAEVLRLYESKADPSSWGSLLETASTLSPEPPPLDPERARFSSAELLLIVQAMGGPEAAPVPTGAGSTRAGYRLDGTPGNEDARVLPAFASFLAHGEPGGWLKEILPDLWALDLEIWERLDAPRSELARLWLTSPGRRLVQDLDALDRIPASKALGATDASLERIYRAAGVFNVPASSEKMGPWIEARPAPWRELHAAVPGELLRHWAPLDDDPLRTWGILERGSPCFQSGAALAWLLDRAMDDPFYETGGIRRDLRDELTSRLAGALEATSRRGADFSKSLEALLLQHAARICEQDNTPGAIQRCWGVARWLHGCLTRSPFFGGDEEGLAARLRALLPEGGTPCPDDADPLHPCRFSYDGTGRDVRELALVSGALFHYRREAAERLQPTPLPLVEALRRVAGRCLSHEELELERLAGAGAETEIFWPAPYIPAPLVARWLMTDLGISWLQHVGEQAQLESLSLFENAPMRHAGWLPFAVFKEGKELPDSLTKPAASIWSALSAADDPGLPPHALALMAIGLLPLLEEHEKMRAIEIAADSDDRWLPRVLDALAGEAEHEDRTDLWKKALDLLLVMVEDEAVKPCLRLEAALYALRRASASRSPGRNEALGRLTRSAGRPPFSTHLGLRRELRRLGLVAK